MISQNNILLISDDELVANNILEKLVLLRANDSISVTSTKNYRKALTNSLYSVIILHQTDDDANTLKLISAIKDIKLDSEIILLLNNENPDLILRAYDSGLSDYMFTSSENYEMLIKTINCFKSRCLKDKLVTSEKFLSQLGVVDSKTGLYHYKYLKDIFIELSDNLRIQNGTLSIITLSKAVKTKISTNRLANAIKSNVRTDDILAVARGGKFYLILPNIDLIGTKEVISKFQNKMGSDFCIHAGIAKIGLQSFESIDKNAQDSLVSAITNDLMTVCLEDKNNVQNVWLDDEALLEKKNFKLFNNVFLNKMTNVISPIFYRYQKLFENKLTNTEVSQYANNVECVFSLKNQNVHSELIIRYDGYAKFEVNIIHSGLESAENTKKYLPLSGLNEKTLNSLFKQLKDEYKKTAYKKG